MVGKVEVSLQFKFGRKEDKIKECCDIDCLCIARKPRTYSKYYLAKCMYPGCGVVLSNFLQLIFKNIHLNTFKYTFEHF